MEFERSVGRLNFRLVNLSPVNFGRLCVAVVLLASACALMTSTSQARAPDTAKSKSDTPQLNAQSAPLALVDAKKLKNPIPFTKKSIAQGRASSCATALCALSQIDFQGS